MFGQFLPRNRGCGVKLRKLYKRHKGKCCYCGSKTFLPKKNERNKGFDLMATIEHKYSKCQLIRLLLPAFKKIKLSCYKCNNERGLQERNKAMEGYNYSEPHDNLLVNLFKEYNIANTN